MKFLALTGKVKWTDRGRPCHYQNTLVFAVCFDIQVKISKMNKKSLSRRELAEKYLEIAEAYSKSRYTDKTQLLAAQLGFLAGLLGQYAENDITMRKDLSVLEKTLNLPR